MAYPNLPWHLKGEGPLIGGVFFVDVDKIGNSIPKEFKVVKILPKKTIGFYYYCKFGKRSEIEYNEFIFFPALVKYKGRIGFWGHSMYVDNKKATYEVYERCGIKKHLANFKIAKDKNEVVVHRENKVICKINYKSKCVCSIPIKRKWEGGKAFGATKETIFHLKGSFNGKLQLRGSSISIPTDSPLYQFNTKKFILGFSFNDWKAELFYTLGKFSRK